MHRLLLAISILVLASITASAQDDSVIIHRVFNSELTATSDTLATGKPYAYFNVHMRKGDIASLQYESKDYVVALGIQDSFGRSTLKEDNPMFFKTIGSRVNMPFRCEEEGMYYFIFTAKERKAVGKFRAELYYYTAANDKITNESPFCDKLRYITDQSIVGFEFIKVGETEGLMFKVYVPRISLLTGGTCDITDALDNIYSCTLESKDRAALEKQFKELDKTIKECLPGSVRKEYTLADMDESEKKDFVKKVAYTMNGVSEGDHNTAHALQKIKYRVTLEIEKSGTTEYKLKVEVE